MRIGADANGHLLDDLQAVTFQPDDFLRIIGEQADGLQAKVAQDLRAQAVLAQGAAVRPREAGLSPGGRGRALRFRAPAEKGGAQYMLATDAAGEGINLQFCWLMVNYDVPWNPARLEQRMGRIHRYKQAHDPVRVINLVAGKTREGRVLGTLLDKLERIRRELGSDKVFDVVGRLFEGVSLREYMEAAVTEDGSAPPSDVVSATTPVAPPNATSTP